MRIASSFMRALACAFVVSALAPSVTAQTSEIGTVASLDPNMEGQRPGGALQRLRTGSTLVSDQRVVTGASGRGQLLFRDQSTLSVGPRTDIVLDRFIYDPNQGTGDIGLSLTRGALRFIGGKATKQSPAQIETPTGTISIRGSSILVLFENGRTLAVLVAGERLCFAPSNSRQRCTNRRGGVLGEQGYAGRIDRQALADLLARIDGTAPPVRQVAAPGTGVVRDNPSDRDPVSSSGGQYDITGPDAPFRTRALEGTILPEGLLDDAETDGASTIDSSDGGGGGRGPFESDMEFETPCDDPSVLGEFETLAECLAANVIS